MKRDDAVILEWLYEPAEFFEEPIILERDDCEICFEDGRVVATVDPEQYDSAHTKREELHRVVEARFLAVQVSRHQPFALHKPGMSRVYPDGRRDVTVFPEPARITIKTGRVDLVVKNVAGNVITDTKRERISVENEFGDAVGRLISTDPLIQKMFDSYRAAVEDPRDELVHLYEIRDALQKHFRGAGQAKIALEVTSFLWKRLGQLADGEPVQQGRHRGAHLIELRKATANELEEARAAARQLIAAYVRHADAG
jgi:hypothetical protein